MLDREVAGEDVDVRDRALRMLSVDRCETTFDILQAVVFTVAVLSGLADRAPLTAARPNRVRWVV